jgi:carnosine N-methyltransferase
MVNFKIGQELTTIGRSLHTLMSYEPESIQDVMRSRVNSIKLASFLSTENYCVKKSKEKLDEIFSEMIDVSVAKRYKLSGNAYFFSTVLSSFHFYLFLPFLKRAFVTKSKLYYSISNLRPRPCEVDKVLYVLKNLVRDWSLEGEKEREKSYGRILKDLERNLNTTRRNHVKTSKVLVPGAGLGRLCLEITSGNLDVHGNECSHYMLIFSSFMLNFCNNNKRSIYPFLHSRSNNLRYSDQMRSVIIPDVFPESLMSQNSALSMCAGDFVQCFGCENQRKKWDFIVTCFFIDTARNLIQYIEVIYHCLKDGGKWINLGPLLYHWTDAHTYLETEELSIEIPLDTIINTIQNTGFFF